MQAFGQKLPVRTRRHCGRWTFSASTDNLRANMNGRRKILVAAALAISLADAGYILWLRLGMADEMKAEWVAYMPALEEKQRRNPHNFLNSSDFHDPDYPSLYVYDGRLAYPLFSKITHDCQIREYTINHYVGPTKITQAVDMPDRLFLGKLNVAMVACLRGSLPSGYVLAKLQSEVVPKRIGWGDNDLHVANAS